MAHTPAIHRYAAFAERADHGNPAGVVLEAQHLNAAQMQAIAADVGYSETAFVTSPLDRDARLTVAYYAPEGEVDFCGHATLATAVGLGHALGFGEFTLETKVGTVPASASSVGERSIGAFQSAPTTCEPLTTDRLEALLGLLGWDRSDLHPDYPPAVGFGGNRHPILVAQHLSRLAELSYDFDALRTLCRAHNWVTLQLITPVGESQWRARDPFPWGGVIEDPATGAAAAAFAGYLRSQGRVDTGDRLTVLQGIEMGRDSRIDVEVLAHAARISGPVTPIPH